MQALWPGLSDCWSVLARAQCWRRSYNWAQARRGFWLAMDLAFHKEAIVETKLENTRAGLEKAHLDLSSVRVQLLLALLLIGLFSLVNCSSLLSEKFDDCEFAMVCFTEPDPAHVSPQVTQAYKQLPDIGMVTAISFVLDSVIWRTAWGAHFTNLLIYIACTALVALICLELTGRFGNRLGAAPAIWSAVLFSVQPIHKEMVSSVVARHLELNLALILLTGFALSRLALLREKSYFFIALASGLLLLANRFIGDLTWPGADVFAHLYPFFARLSSLDPVGHLQSANLYAVGCAYLILAVLAITRILCRWTKPSVFAGVLSGLLVSLLFFSHSQGTMGLSPDLTPALVYGSVPFCIMLVICALPAFDGINLRLSRVISILGLIALSTLALAWS